MGIRLSSSPPSLSSFGAVVQFRLDGHAGNRAPRGADGFRFAEFAARYFLFPGTSTVCFRYATFHQPLAVCIAAASMTHSP